MSGINIYIYMCVYETEREGREGERGFTLTNVCRVGENPTC